VIIFSFWFCRIVCVGKKSRASTDGTRYTYLFYYMILVPFFIYLPFLCTTRFYCGYQRKKGLQAFSRRLLLSFFIFLFIFLIIFIIILIVISIFVRSKEVKNLLYFTKKGFFSRSCTKVVFAFFCCYFYNLRVFFLVVMSVFCIWPPRFYIKQTKKKNKKCSCKKREKGISPRKRLQRNVLCFS